MLSAIEAICCFRENEKGNKDDESQSSHSDDDSVSHTENEFHTTDDLEKFLEQYLLPKDGAKERSSNNVKNRTVGTWIEIRLFISSTFVDTHSERDIIIRRVIPSINRKLAPKFIRVIPVDLRWGVTAEESMNCHKIQKTCLNHIDRCRGNSNWTPWFLGLRTQRYGWVQNEYMMSEGFEQPRFFKWLDKMKNFNRGVSITSLECMHAARTPKKLTTKPTVFFYEREIVETPLLRIPHDKRWIFDFEFVEDEIQDPQLKFQYTLDKKDARGKEMDRNKLNNFLKSQNHILYRNYSCIFSHAKITAERKGAKSYGIGYTKKLQYFEEHVEKDLLEAITANYEEVDNSQMSKFDFESIQHENAIRDKASTFVGRKDLRRGASKFLSDQNNKSKSTMILHGEPGCGKSGLLAAVANEAIETYRTKGHFVFVHVVDCCPGSAVLDGLLRRFNSSLRSFRRSLGEINLDPDPPAATSDLKNEHHQFMNESAEIYPDKKFIIIVDAVNQLDSSLQSWDMWWLNNHEAPNNLKFLISTLNEENGTFENAKEMCPTALCVPVLEMKSDDLKEMIRGRLLKFNKKLTEDDTNPLLGNQMDLLIQKSTSPLYLIAACEALRRFGIFEKVTEYLKSLPNTVPALFEFLLDEWSDEYGKDFVEDVTALICVSRNGLLENEIQDILSFKERSTGIVYDANFSRIYDSLSTFLSAGGGGYLRFFHDQLKFVVARKILNVDLERKTHDFLAKFFLSVVNTQYGESPEIKPMAYHEHALNQLVYHQIKAHKDGKPMQFLKDTLRNIYFVRERVIFGQQQELDDEYEMVKRYFDDGEELAALADWRSFTQLYCPRIQEFDAFALNMAKNQAKNSHVTNDVSSLSTISKGLYPLQWKNTPVDIDPMIVKYDAGGMDISSNRVGNVIATAGHMCELLHISSGEILHRINIKACAIMMSGDGEKVLIGCDDGYVRVYDVSTGMEEFECALCLNESVVFVHWTETHIIAATGSKDGAICWDDYSTPSTVLVANRDDGSTLKTWNTGKPSFHHCFSSSLNMIFTSHKGMIIGWDMDGQEVVRQSNNLGDVVYSLASHATKDLILSGSNDLIIREWEVSKNRNKMKLLNKIVSTTSSGWFYGGIWSVSYDHTGDRILATEPQSQSLRIYLKDGTLQEELRGHQECINKISLVNDGACAVTCDRGGMSILWKLPKPSSKANSSLKKIDEKVLWCSFNPDGTKYVTGAHGMLRIFDTKTQKQENSNSDTNNHYSISGEWMPDGKHFVVRYDEIHVAWFNIELRLVSKLQCFETDDSSITDVALSPDGTRVVVSDCRNMRSESSAAIIIDCSDIFNPFKCDTISDYGARMFACDINKSGDLVAIAGHAGTVVYNLHTLERQYELTSGCFFVKFKADDKLLYENDNQLHLFDPEEDQDIVSFSGHSDTVQVACFFDNDRMILSAADDGTLRLYETSTGKNIYGFFSHQAQGYKSLTIHPDEKLVIAADESMILYILSTE